MAEKWLLPGDTASFFKKNIQKESVGFHPAGHPSEKLFKSPCHQKTMETLITHLRKIFDSLLTAGTKLDTGLRR